MPVATVESMGRKKSENKTQAVRIDASVAMKAARVAEDRGVPLSQFLTELVKDRVEREWLKIVQRAADLERDDRG